MFRSTRDNERRYLSEAGCHAFDEVRRLYVVQHIQMMDTSIHGLPEYTVSESQLVNDVCSILIGLPSRSFHWSYDGGSPVCLLLFFSVSCVPVPVFV